MDGGRIEAADMPSAGKRHFEVLDGMRGSAAILVVLFHIMGMPIAWTDEGQLLHHAALAVDFFFGLSGFVIAYSYDDRWPAMSTGRFFALRLIRLHPGDARELHRSRLGLGHDVDGHGPHGVLLHHGAVALSRARPAAEDPAELGRRHFF